MLAFISCAKTMADSVSRIEVPFTTIPHFEAKARENALAMSQVGVDELAHMFRINNKLATENCLRYRNFFSEDNAAFPAVLAYTGMVFKHIGAVSFTSADFVYAQEHLFIASFLYGLLRPLDQIKRYRLEGGVRMPGHDCTVFDYWKLLLTDYFIDIIMQAGGVLVYLASAEMKKLFQWKRVERSVRVITPEFWVMKNGKPKTVTLYAKMCRGEMVRFLLKNRIEDAEQLAGFQWEGFAFHPEASAPDRPIFILG